jgi:hypothetical protein
VSSLAWISVGLVETPVPTVTVGGVNLAELGLTRPTLTPANLVKDGLKIGPLAQALPVPPCTRRERAPGTEQAGHIPSSQLLKLLVDREPLGVIALLPSGPDQAINFVVG